MGCEDRGHLWTARFFRSGALAFWFCRECGETDRDVDGFQEPLEDVTGFPDIFPMVVRRGETPDGPGRRWKLQDGSILQEGPPSSAEFRGMPIPDLPDCHQYDLTITATGEQRIYVPRFERSSTTDDCFILTRYAVQDNRLVKYRIHCCEYTDDRTVKIDEPNGNTILSGLEPVS